VAKVVSVKYQNGVLPSREEYIIGRLREYFKDLLNSVTLATSDTLEVHLGEENTITVTEVFLIHVFELQQSNHCHCFLPKLTIQLPEQKRVEMVLKLHK